MKRTPMTRSGPLARSHTLKKKQVPALRPSLKARQRAVTPQEKELWGRLANEIGCIACMKDGRRNTYVSIHHVDGRTKPGCHQRVLPLCAQHHQRDDTDPLQRIAVHPDQGRFEKRYGSQLELVDECMTLLNWIGK